MIADRYWKWIVKKDGDYLMAAINGRPRWSNNRSDAVMIDYFSDALAVAEKVNGEVKRYNAVTQEEK